MDAYPLTFDVMPPEGPRNRLTRAFRIILAIPHCCSSVAPGVGWGANQAGRRC